MNAMFMCALYLWSMWRSGGGGSRGERTCSHVKSINERTARLCRCLLCAAVVMRSRNWHNGIMIASESSPSSILIQLHAFQVFSWCWRFLWKPPLAVCSLSCVTMQMDDLPSDRWSVQQMRTWDFELWKKMNDDATAHGHGSLVDINSTASQGKCVDGRD